MIAIENLCKSFPGKEIFHNFSAILPDAAITALSGPSGCGKTTLAHIILGLAPFQSGVIFFDGGPRPKGKLAAVFQEDRLLEDASVLKNVELILRKEDLPRAEEILSRLSLSRDLHQPVRLLSGGMKRRVAIARALAAPSRFLVLDEPFKGLDRTLRDSIIGYIKESVRGKTVLFISHDREELSAMADHVIYL